MNERTKMMIMMKTNETESKMNQIRDIILSFKYNLSKQKKKKNYYRPNLNITNNNNNVVFILFDLLLNFELIL